MCNMTRLEDVGTGVLLEFRELQRCVERGEWITSTPVYVELPIEREDRGRNSGISGNGVPIQAHRKAEVEKKREAEPQIKVMEKFGFF